MSAAEPPHNLEAERSVLGGLFIKPSAFEEVAASLQVDDFFLPAHREIFEAMLAVVQRRQPIDVIAVADELRVRGMIARLDGGEVYLLTLSNSVPTAENIGHYARLVKEKATLRRLQAACAEIQSRAGGDFGEFDPFMAEATSQIEAVARNLSAPALSLSDQVRALGSVGVVTCQTPFPTLNVATRGGIRAGQTVIGGAPGAGKTTALVALALYFARQGFFVTILAADEEPNGLLIRMGQTEGYGREDLETGRPVTVASFAERAAVFSTLALLDGERVTVEGAAAELNRRANGATRVLMVDSIQTARALGTDDAETARSRVDAVMKGLRAAARTGIVVVATSEVSRAAYRSRNPAERIDGLAAFKESGGIEYGAHLGIVMRSVPGEVGLVDVEIVKNRWGGQKPTFRLRLDFAMALFSEVPVDDQASDDPRMVPGGELAGDMERARAILRENPGIAGNDQLIAKLGVSKTRGRAAVRSLEAAGEVENRGQGKMRRLFLVDSPNSPNSPNSPGGSGGFNSPNSPHPYRGASCGASNPGGYAPGSDEGTPGRVEDVV